MARYERLRAVLVAVTGFGVTVAAIYCLYRLDQHPWVIRPSPVAPLGTLASAGEGEALVCVDADRIRAAALAGAHAARDAGAAWWNWVAQAFGPGRMIDVASLSPEISRDARLLIMTRSAAGFASPVAERAAQTVLEAGGAVVLEMPGPAWSGLSGVALGEESWASRHMNRVAGLDLERFAAPLAGITLPIRLRAVARVDPGVTPLMWLGGGPVTFLRRSGNGAVVTLAFDMGRLLQDLQQGVPDPDGKVRNRYPKQHADVLETNDMVVDQALLNAEDPVADALEDWLFQVLAREAGLVGWWLFPDGAPGAFAMTHDEEGMGPKAAWMAEAESTWSCPSTNFLVPSPGVTQEALSRYREAGASVGLHYVMPSPDGTDYPGSGVGVEGRYRVWGFWRIHPVRRLLSPAEQFGWLAARGSPGAVAPVSRTHFLAWTPEYTALFQALEKAGMRLDSSYGPDLQDRGYLFGTGRPFHPLDAMGLPLSILELPFVSAEDLGGADREFLHRLMAESAAQTHQVVAVLFHPNAFRWHPSVSNYFTWKALCRDARALGLLPMSLVEVDAFFRARGESRLKTRIEGHTIVVGYRFPRAGGALVFPAEFRDTPLATVSQQDQALTARKTALVGSPVVVVPVPGMEGEIRAYYAGDTEGDTRSVPGERTGNPP